LKNSKNLRSWFSENRKFIPELLWNFVQEFVSCSMRRAWENDRPSELKCVKMQKIIPTSSKMEFFNSISIQRMFFRMQKLAAFG
jgi:hypothetical protein